MANRDRYNTPTSPLPRNADAQTRHIRDLETQLRDANKTLFALREENAQLKGMLNEKLAKRETIKGGYGA